MLDDLEPYKQNFECQNKKGDAIKNNNIVKYNFIALLDNFIVEHKNFINSEEGKQTLLMIF
jgi:hypothetical protein